MTSVPQRGPQSKVSEALRFLGAATLIVVTIGLLEASPSLLGIPAPSPERLRTLAFLILNYGFYGLAGSVLLVPLVLGRPAASRWLLGLIWTGAAFVLVGDQVHEEWLEVVPVLSATGLAATAAVAVVALATAPFGVRLVLARPGLPVLAWGLLGAASLLGASSRQTDPVRAAARPGAPNVVLILADTLRPDHLGHCGDPRGLSPHLDRLARQGLQLGRAYSTSSWTKPAVTSVFTSRLPHQHGVNGYFDLLSRQHATLAQSLRAQGYATGGFSTNRMISSLSELDRGFEVFWNQRAHRLLSTTALGRLGARFSFMPVFGLDRTVVNRSGETVNREALRWLDSHQPSPFFLYLHYMETHDPYKPPPQVVGPTRTGVKELFAPPVKGPRPFVETQRFSEDLESDYRLLYGGSVRHLDSLLGTLLADLRQRGALQHSIVTVLSDHGEEFLEHGSWSHAHSLHEEMVRVEMLFQVTPAVEAPRLSMVPASLIDVFPTLFDWLGLPLPEGPVGLSLRPVLAGASLPPRDLLFEYLHRYSFRGLFRDSIKAWRIEGWGEPWQQAFDLNQDPAEQSPLAADDPRAASLFRALAELDKADLSQEAAGSTRSELESELKSLGYVK